MYIHTLKIFFYMKEENKISAAYLDQIMTRILLIS